MTNRRAKPITQAQIARPTVRAARQAGKQGREVLADHLNGCTDWELRTLGFPGGRKALTTEEAT